MGEEEEVYLSVYVFMGTGEDWNPVRVVETGTTLEYNTSGDDTCVCRSGVRDNRNPKDR